MKPLYLEFQAFGPYKGKESVNFEKLSNSGIFLIKGPTGSGKTTIFDAMTFALYGGGSGDGRSDFATWRCNQVEKTVKTYVQFEFESNGARYRFTREYEFKRSTFSDKHTAEKQNCEGGWEPLVKSNVTTQTTQKAVELIGLTREQFSQVVLLPQGQFEKFLTSESKDKEGLLKKIFRTDKWEHYAEYFYKAAKNRKDELDAIKNRIEILLADEGEEFKSLDDISDHIDALECELAEIENKHKAFDSSSKQLKLTEDIALSEKFKQLEKLAKEKVFLQAQKESIDEMTRILEDAEKAEAVRAIIEAFENASEESIDRQKTYRDEASKIAAKKEAQDVAYTAMKEHEANSTVGECRKKITEYEVKKPAYSNMKEAAEMLMSAESIVHSSEETVESAKKSLEDATRTAAEKFARCIELEAAVIDVRKKYYSGIYGELAADLKESEKCPVCGSTSHPEPAKRSPDSVSKADVDTAEKTADSARKTSNIYEEKQKRAEDECNRADKILREAKSDYKIAKNEYERCKSQLIDGIEDTATLERKIKSLENEIEKYNADAEKLADNFEKAKQAYLKQVNAEEHARQEMKKAKEHAEVAKTELDTQLKANGYESVDQVKSFLKDAAERKVINDGIVEYRTKCELNGRNLKQKSLELSGVEAPDETAFVRRQDEITNEGKEYQANKTAISRDVQRLSKKLKELMPLEKTYNKNIVQAESDEAFAKKLKGYTSINLHRYVLGIMFNQVIAEANEMLKDIHGGRYYLIRTDKGKGLDLIVHDSRALEAKGRGVGTLSGGEKFLVSLALSIGMSSVAQKSGIRIEALFIDEGFGTLDDESINDAMDVLEYVKRSNSLVGIISHVQLLEANIGTHIEVVKSDEGSTLR